MCVGLPKLSTTRHYNLSLPSALPKSDTHRLVIQLPISFSSKQAISKETYQQLYVECMNAISPQSVEGESAIEVDPRNRLPSADWEVSRSDHGPSGHAGT